MVYNGIAMETDRSIPAAGLFEQATLAADYIRKQSSLAPRIGVILGSGLGAVAESIENPTAISYTEIPHFPRSTVVGHSGRLLLGRLAGVPVAVMQGRVHFYEGHPAYVTTFPVRVLRQLEVRTLVVTNASGGIRPGMQQGELVLIADHINLTGANPLIGHHEPRWGERFFDMTEPYSGRLREVALSVAQDQGLAISEGVYLAVSGPSFETPAEIRAFRTLGADMVGMSTVHEVIVARHMNMEVLGISCVTNLASGIQKEPLSHLEVLETGRRVQHQLAALLAGIAPLI